MERKIYIQTIWTNFELFSRHLIVVFMCSPDFRSIFNQFFTPKSLEHINSFSLRIFKGVLIYKFKLGVFANLLCGNTQSDGMQYFYKVTHKKKTSLMSLRRLRTFAHCCCLLLYNLQTGLEGLDFIFWQHPLRYELLTVFAWMSMLEKHHKVW